LSILRKALSAVTLILFTSTFLTGCAPEVIPKVDEKVIIGLADDSKSSKKTVKPKESSKPAKESKTRVDVKENVKPKTETKKKTTAPVKPKTAPKVTPKPEVAPKPETKKKSSTVSGTVHPGAFCHEPGAKGKTEAGTKMECKKTAKDNRERWRKQ